MKEAYCVELDKIITGDEAWRMAFGGEAVKTKELTFRCPDAKCRAVLLASNLKAVSSSSEVYFKTHLKARHEPYCNFTSKGSLMTEIASPDEAKEIFIHFSKLSVREYFRSSEKGGREIYFTV